MSSEDTKCCCRHYDARQCFLIRHPQYRRRADYDPIYDSAIDEVCECSCHDQDMDEYFESLDMTGGSSSEDLPSFMSRLGKELAEKRNKQVLDQLLPTRPPEVCCPHCSRVCEYDEQGETYPCLSCGILWKWGFLKS